jgi:nucleoside-diphosphate-sugar epimerase
MNVTVVGGAGYVGSVLCPMLALNKNIKLKVIDSFWFWQDIHDYGAIIGKFPTNTNKNVELVEADIRDNIDCHLKGSDIVINLACISNDISSDLDPKFTHDVSYNGVMNVIKGCERLGIRRLIQVSSGSVYGVKETPVREGTYEEPITQYAVIKMEIDHYLQHLMKSGNHKITILRPATLYGRSPRQRLDLMINIFADKVAHNEPIVVHGGQQSRPSLHVRDISDAIIKLLRDGRSFNQIYNISKEAMTVLEYAKIFENMYGTEIVIEKVNDARSWRTDSEKMYRDLGIIHRTKLEQGIKELVNDFRECEVDRDYSVNMQVVKRLLCR